MSTCPHCGSDTDKARRLFAARVGRPAKLNRTNPDAAHNALATDIAAAEDVIDPHAAPLVVLGPGGEYQTRVELPRVDSTGMKAWFDEVARALGYRTEGDAK